MKYKNKWYPTLLIVALALGITVQSYNLLAGEIKFPILHLSLSLFVIVSLIRFSTNITEIFVKIWSGLAIIGGSLGLISSAMFLMIGRFEDNVETPELIRHLLHFSIGLIFFKYWNSSIQEEDNFKKDYPDV